MNEVELKDELKELINKIDSMRVLQTLKIVLETILE